MASFRFNGSNGRPFRKTVVVAKGAPLPEGLQPGQWIRVGNAKKAERFVSYDGGEGGKYITVKAKRKGTVSVDSFRLARRKPAKVVLGVNGSPTETAKPLTLEQLLGF